MELVISTIASKEKFTLRPHLLRTMNHHATQKLRKDAGQFRAYEVGITQTMHKPPGWPLVCPFVEDLCDYINHNWKKKSAIKITIAIGTR